MPTYHGDPAFVPESSPLSEWDRYTITPPIPDDREWRFTMSGIYTDYLLEEMQSNPTQLGALTTDQIIAVRSLAKVNHETYGGLFELTRLALHLPAYFDFMYDLVIKETIPDPKHPAKAQGHEAKAGKGIKNDVQYKIIKSIRVIREQDFSEKTIRKWTAPIYSFAVAGHWRYYKYPTVKGRDPAGEVVFGKTWVRDYSKGKGKPPRPENIDGFHADPKVVINIKQTIAYARDIIEARNTSSDFPICTPDTLYPEMGTSQKTHRPTKEWMTIERSKLNSALRFIILRRDDFRCRLCGRSAAEDSDVRLEVDHIKPISSWGTTVEQNLWTVCRECNRGKADRSI
jgi:hypothetical protein